MEELLDRLNAEFDESEGWILIGIQWTDAESSEYIDVFSTDAFEASGFVPEYEHLVTSQRGGIYYAKCSAEIYENVAELNYEAYPEFNNEQDWYLGILRLEFKDETRATLSAVGWRGKGRKRFQSGVAEVLAEILPPVKPYVAKAGSSKRVSRDVKERKSQTKFREKLMLAYAGRCCITGCNVRQALEAAHIDPFSSELSNHPQNGLLLRKDLHSLFDANLLGIEPESCLVHFSLAARAYGQYEKIHNIKLSDPKAGNSYSPAKSALVRRWKEFCQTGG